MFTLQDVSKFPRNAVIGITGTRRGGSTHQLICLRRILWNVNPIILHHGDCIGFDTEAHRVAFISQIPITIHPPLIPSNRAWCRGAIRVMDEKDYDERNRAIVDACNVLIAAPYTDKQQVRSGTWMTMRYAWSIGKPVYQLPRELYHPATKEV